MAPALTDPSAAFDPAPQLPFEGCCDDHLNPPYLPPYSPELNPDEGVNADLKQAVTRKAPARSGQQLMRAALSHMHSLSKQPRRIRSIFHHRQFRYAA